MLHLHTDLYYSELYKKLLLLIQSSNSLFEKPTLVIPNHSVKSWLQQSLARDLSICSQIDFMMPLEFIWKQTQTSHPSSNTFNPFRKEVLRWYLCEKIQNHELSALLDLYEADELKQWNAAENLASALIQYTQEQPLELINWEERPKHWQAKIWKQLLDDLNLSSPVVILNQLNHDHEKPSGTSPIIFFAVEQLSEYQFLFLQGISASLNIHYMLTNPCPEEFWADTRSQSSIERTRHFHPELAELLDVGNPILSSLGQNKMSLFNAFFNTENIDAIEPTSYLSPRHDSMLESVKTDIYNLQEPKIVFTDSSIKVHSCHNNLRQIEVVKDEILNLLNQNKDLQPSDIYVVAPDINVFKDAIHMAFAGGPNSQPLNFHIDRMHLEDSEYIQALLALVSSLSEEMTSSNIYNLLCHENIYKHLELDRENLSIIKKWLSESNVRSFYSKHHRQDKGYEPTSINTFEFGEHRWITGFLSGDESDTDHSSVFGDLAGSETIFSQLFDFLDNWHFFSTKLNSSKITAEEWGNTFKALSKKFIYDDYKQTQEKQVFEIIDRVFIENTLSAQPHISLTLASKILQQSLEDNQFRPFGKIGVRFQSWENAFIAPAKALFVMGLNENSFPQKEPKNDFDIFKDRVSGLRRQVRGRDRNLLLTALTESHQHLILTYNGFNNKTNDEQPPSPLLRELIDYLEEKTQGGFKVQYHQLHGFHDSYFNTQREYNSYNLSNYESAKHLRAFKPVKVNEKIALTKVDSSNSIHIQEIQSFFKDPLSYFLKHHAKINFDIYSDNLKEFESYTVDGLEKWKLKKICFEENIEQASKTGLLMNTSQGHSNLMSINDDVQFIKNHKAESQLKQISKTIVFNNYTIRTEIDVNKDDEFQSYSLSGFMKSTKDIATHWVQHLFFNHDKTSHLHCLDEKTIEFKPVENAKSIQKDILQIWNESQATPWVFLPSASFKFYYGKPKLKEFQEYQSSFSQSTHVHISEAQKYFEPDLNESDLTEFQTKFIQPLLDHIEILK